MPPGPANLRAANLNLIPVLRVLLKEASVSRAAESLGLSQSATSGALARLRLLMGDPILVQVGRSMKLTPRASELLTPLEQLCGSLEDLIRSAPFDPMAAQRRFTIAAPEYTGVLIGNALIDALHRTAPGVSAYFMDVPKGLPARLTSGEIDMAILDIDWPEWEGLSSRALFSDHLVGLVARDHPLANKAKPSAADVRSFPNIRWRSRTPVGDDFGPTQVVAQFTVLPLLALDSRCVAEVPKMLADRMAQILPLTSFELPFSPRTISGGLLWSPVQEADPAHRWFRNLVGEIVGGLS